MEVKSIQGKKKLEEDKTLKTEEKFQQLI